MGVDENKIETLTGGMATGGMTCTFCVMVQIMSR